MRPRIELHPEDHAYRQPVTLHHDWRVTTGLRRPDGLLKQVYLINGEFPKIDEEFQGSLLTEYRSLSRPDY